MIGTMCIENKLNCRSPVLSSESFIQVGVDNLLVVVDTRESRAQGDGDCIDIRKKILKIYLLVIGMESRMI